MPRVRPEDYLDYDDEDSLDIQDDLPTDRRGRPVQPRQVPREDRDWEEARKRAQQRRRIRDAD